MQEKTISSKWELSIYDIKSIFIKFLIYWVPTIMGYLVEYYTQIPWATILWISIAPIIDMWKKYKTDYISIISQISKENNL